MVCGSRDLACDWLVFATLDDLKPDVVVAGDAAGPDAFALLWADRHGVPRVEFKADWKAHGKAAGPMRNNRMIVEGRPTLVLAFWDGNSAGTLHAISTAVRAGIRVNVFPAGV